MLDDLRSVPRHTALGLTLAGAIVTIAMAMVIDSIGGSAAAPKRPQSSRVSSGDSHAVGGARPKLVTEAESPQDVQVSIANMVGQRFMVGLSEANPSPLLLQDARRGEIGGVLMFARNSTPAAVGAAAARLRQAARAGHQPPLLIAIDQEGGPVKRFPEGPPYTPLSQLSRGAAAREGLATGRYLRQYHVNTDLAPVVDLGLPGSFIAEQGRTISKNPRRVAGVAGAFASGLKRTKVIPVPKHFPGLGQASVDSDKAKSVVEAGVGSSLQPYRRLIAGGVPAIMVSTAFYTKLDPGNGAAWSPRIVEGLLRRRLAFKGVVISDDLSTAGVAESLSSPAIAARAAALAGVDILMVGDPNSFRSAYKNVLRAAERGRISRRNLTSSYYRILAVKERFGS